MSSHGPARDVVAVAATTRFFALLGVGPAGGRTFGIVLGSAASTIAGRALTALLYGVRPGDPRTLLVGGVVLLAVGGGAAMIPARRASRIGPLVALRME